MGEGSLGDSQSPQPPAFLFLLQGPERAATVRSALRAAAGECLLHAPSANPTAEIRTPRQSKMQKPPVDRDELERCHPEHVDDAHGDPRRQPTGIARERERARNGPVCAALRNEVHLQLLSGGR